MKLIGNSVTILMFGSQILIFRICYILQENNNISGYSNPELDMISKDIAELVRERQSMEQDIAQKEADIKIKNGEIKSLQSELDTLAATLKQLGNQKGEAQKRLNDLKAQVNASC